MKETASAAKSFLKLSEKLRACQRNISKFNPNYPDVKKAQKIAQFAKEAQAQHEKLIDEMQAQNFAHPLNLVADNEVVARHMLGDTIAQFQGFAEKLGVLKTSLGVLRTKEALQRDKTRALDCARLAHRMASGLSKLFSGSAFQGNISIGEVLRQVKEDQQGKLDLDGSTVSLQVNPIQEKASFEPNLLYWSVSELVGNSLKSLLVAKLESKGVVSVKNYLKGKEHVIEVSDNGVGIKPELLEGEKNILSGYRGFFHEHNILSSGKILPNIKRVVEQHGGRLEVESKYGHGATFRIILPKGKASKPNWSLRKK